MTRDKFFIRPRPPHYYPPEAEEAVKAIIEKVIWVAGGPLTPRPMRDSIGPPCKKPVTQGLSLDFPKEK